MEEDFLESFLAGEEVDIINQQNIDVAEMVAEIRQGFPVQGIDVQIAEFLTEQILDFGLFYLLADGLGNGLQQMSLAKAGRTMDEKRIVNRSRRAGNGMTGAMGEAVVAADDERIESVMGIETADIFRCGTDRCCFYRWGGILLSDSRLGLMPLFKENFQFPPGLLQGSIRNQLTIIFRQPVSKNIFRDAQHQIPVVKTKRNDVGNPHGKGGWIQLFFEYIGTVLPKLFD